MGRGGFHGLATGHLDDVSFINIQPVIKAARIERSEGAGRERRRSGDRRKRWKDRGRGLKIKGDLKKENVKESSAA